jgi:hypothetical protein
MKRTMVNFVVDTVTFLAMAVVVVTGVVMEWVLPPGSPGRGLTLLGLDRHGWGDVHFWGAVSLAVLVIVHLWLHWAWICTMVNRVIPGADARGPVSVERRRVAGALTAVVATAVFGGLVFGGRALVRSDRDAAEGEGEGGGQRRRRGGR